jgi:FlaA1/EpsC-like NDP-sugar epimerase
MLGTGIVVWIRAQLTPLPRLKKRLFLVANDSALLMFSLWAALSFRYGAPYVPTSAALGAVLLSAPVIGVLCFLWGGVYRQVTRYFDTRGTSQLAVYSGLSVLIWSLVVFLSAVQVIPRSVVALYGALGFTLVYASRKAASWLLGGSATSRERPQIDRTPVVIYGAGQTGVQLLEALRHNGTAECVGFLDASPSLWGQYVGGIKVYRPEKLSALIERAGVTSIYLAVTDAERRQRSAILKWLQHYPVRVQVLPAMEDLAAGRVTINALRPVQVDDLLGRDPSPPDPALLAQNITGKSVMVTGAGGSIGSELVRKILRQAPRRLVLFEVSEAALYEIEMEVLELLQDADGGGAGVGPKFGTIAAAKVNKSGPQIVPILGSVLDPALVEKTIRQHGVATIYHAAAYKHVPLVEANPIMGITNNTFGTKIVAEAAIRANVERVVLISSDKAVRPTNVMGASKRLAELVLQAHASAYHDAAATDDDAKDTRSAKNATAGKDTKQVNSIKGGNGNRRPVTELNNTETVFTIVRFGNVLDSSGSVLRRFRKQIATDGPVTVTHPEVIRYFMSIPEAAELVIQAGALATGGEVFVLEMGEPVRIDDLARTMIHLSGLEVRDADHPNGDIAIEYTGLRPGEKLFEELLLSDNAVGTDHPRILRINDPYLSVAALTSELDVLKTAMEADDLVAIQAILTRIVEGYSPSAASPAPALPTLPWVPSRTLH